MIGQWPVQRPRWASLLGVVACSAGGSSLVYASLPIFTGNWLASGLALVVFGLAARWAFYRMIRRPAHAGTLSLCDGGLWMVASNRATTTMRLTHAWSAAAWMTLQFRDTVGDSNKSIEVTIWRSTVSRQAWSELCVHVARQVAMPGRILQKEML